MRALSSGFLILAVTLVVATHVAYATHWQEEIRKNGIAAAIKKFGSIENQGLDTYMQQKGIPTQEATKVVPLVHPDTGEFISAKRATVGAVQVAGPAAAVNKVQAVAIFEKGGGAVGEPSGRFLVPVDSLEPWKKLQRVVGVGVSVIIFVKECKAWPDLPSDGCR